MLVGGIAPRPPLTRLSSRACAGPHRAQDLRRDVGIEVGHTLDKYTLLEKVGQGGMAVVYRGLDTSLKREVAIKVLHRHLADHAEARDRFEREAQAVAKLRHENILEIFDYSGRGSDESYIVTEFIAGQTLKEFITDHDIRYPEIGAMIAVQVGRALGHAHAFGVLHRDVKPENIMIRNDGVVKLTDFGIAQMLDVQRLTMTGQLLGSPAYMAPEHVEGKPLDVRTDVFAVGIVLYQLITGELPFKGRNPHEILKRIAEGKFTPPDKQNPLVGNRLTGIVQKALAREPDDRFPDVPALVLALERYLAESGLSDVPGELGRFFAAPVSYEMALKPRLVASLGRLGRERLRHDRNSALELFNRVLTLDPGNTEVVREIERMSRRTRGLKLGIGLGAALIVAGGATWIRSRAGASPPSQPMTASAAARESGRASRRPTPAVVLAPPGDAGPRATTAPATGAAEPPEGGAAAGARDGASRTSGAGGAGDDAERGRAATPATERSAGLDHPPPAGAPRRSFTLNLSPWRGSEVSVDGGAWRALGKNLETVELGSERAVVRARNPSCCLETERVVEPERPPGELEIQLDFAPASVTPRCERPGVTAAVDGRPWNLGDSAPIPITAMTGKARGTVTFTDGKDYLAEVPYVLRPAESMDVPCP
jgi:serine/threonine protein kinase